jgi:hypothetical protein
MKSRFFTCLFLLFLVSLVSVAMPIFAKIPESIILLPDRVTTLHFVNEDITHFFNSPQGKWAKALVSDVQGEITPSGVNIQAKLRNPPHWQLRFTIVPQVVNGDLKIKLEKIRVGWVPVSSRVVDAATEELLGYPLREWTLRKSFPKAYLESIQLLPNEMTVRIRAVKK